jgi:hypothetical protein
MTQPCSTTGWRPRIVNVDALRLIDVLADALTRLYQPLATGFAGRLEDVDDRKAYRRLAPTRGF